MQRMTHLDKDLPPPSRSPSPRPQAFVQRVLHLIRSFDLGHRGFPVGRRDLGFAVAQVWSGQGGRSRYHDTLDDPARSDPSLRLLEGTHKLVDGGGEFPRRVDSLPTQHVSLKEQDSATNSTKTVTTDLHGTTPRSRANSLPRRDCWGSVGVALAGGPQ